MSVDIHASCCRLRGNVSPESDPQLVKQATLNKSAALTRNLQREAMQPATRSNATCNAKQCNPQQKRSANPQPATRSNATCNKSAALTSNKAQRQPATCNLQPANARSATNVSQLPLHARLPCGRDG